MVLLVDLPAKATFNVTAGLLWVVPTLGRLALVVMRFSLVVVCLLVVLLWVVVDRLVVVVEGTLVVDEGVINRCGSIVDRPILFTNGFLVARTAEPRTSCGFLACKAREEATC